jgi:hypothetical protein
VILASKELTRITSFFLPEKILVPEIGSILKRSFLKLIELTVISFKSIIFIESFTCPKEKNEKKAKNIKSRKSRFMAQKYTQ